MTYDRYIYIYIYMIYRIYNNFYMKNRNWTYIHTYIHTYINTLLRPHWFLHLPHTVQNVLLDTWHNVFTFSCIYEHQCLLVPSYRRGGLALLSSSCYSVSHSQCQHRWSGVLAHQQLMPLTEQQLDTDCSSWLRLSNKCCNKCNWWSPQHVQ